MGKVAEAATALEQAFLRTMPRDRKQITNEAKWTEALKRFHVEARTIRQQYSLGVFSRAGAAYRLQQRLVGAGYPPHAVRQVIFALILNVFIGKG